MPGLFRKSSDVSGAGGGRPVVQILLSLFAVVVLIAILAVLLSPHFYLLQQVEPDEVGIRIRGGQLVDVVPPGIYSDIGLFVKLERYSTSEVRFSEEDPEVLTKDQQRIGVTVNGSVFRPSTMNVTQIKQLWVQYHTVLSSNDALLKVMSGLSQQAIKVCVGDKLFSESVVGSSRDDLRNCVDKELSGLIKPYGLTVANIVVPNVALSDEVKAKLDMITQSRLDTEKAMQDEKKAIAEGKAQQAQQEASIRVEQSRKQEETRQQTVLAQLDQERLAAQQKVIEAQKANDLISAQKDLEISKAQAAAAAEKAKADLAKETALAALYQTNTNYYTYQIALANAQAIKDTDKFIITPDGVFPNLVLGNGIVPTIPSQGTVVPQTQK